MNHIFPGLKNDLVDFIKPTLPNRIGTGGNNSEDAPDYILNSAITQEAVLPYAFEWVSKYNPLTLLIRVARIEDECYFSLEQTLWSVALVAGFFKCIR